MTKFMVKIAMNAEVGGGGGGGGGGGDGEFLIQGIFSNLVLAAGMFGRFDHIRSLPL